MTEEILDWSPRRSLQWSDFLAEPNPAVYQDAVTKVTYRFTWTVTSEKMGAELIFRIKNIQLATEFQKNLSWVREIFATNNLLNHQQGFFDLAEEIRPVITENLSNLFANQNYPIRGMNESERMQFAKEDSALLIRDKLDKLYDSIFLKEAEKYESETAYGENLSKQQEYDKRFDKLRN